MRLVFQVAAFKPEATLDLGDQHILIFVSARAAAVESLLHLLDYAKLRDDDYVRQMKKYMNKELFKGIEIEPDHVVV
ncbi:unnamed protein product [Rotaria socialis]|uniref:Uncharacterized protein n=1 Tax=Rotaria socialis TaxID=392032 RepID=A0A820S467_9BILA|nr:unnamed protein product [Rotaria socialis]